MYHIYNFPMLPIELSSHIHKFVLSNAANTIIQKWYSHIAKKTIATELILEITRRNEPPTTLYELINNFHNNEARNINCFDSRVESVMRYCKNVITGIEDKEWWLKKMSYIGDAIYLNYHEFNNANRVNQQRYMNICLFYKQITDKFTSVNDFLLWEHNNTNIADNFINTYNI